jgi:transcriptional regulator with XRE-family HTH domain
VPRNAKSSEDPDLVLDQIGLRIVKRRQELGLMQKALAEAIGMQAANLSQIEKGKQNVTIRTLCKIAEALGTTVGELVAGSRDDSAT